MDFNSINERLKDILSNKRKGKVKDTDVARALGISPNAYSGMKFRNAVPYKEIMDFLAKNKISISLFFYGQTGLNDEEFKTLRMFDVNASLGGGSNNDKEEYENVMISKKILERSNVSYIGTIDLIRAVGESMEPYIINGDTCFIAVGYPLKDGEIYAVNTFDGVVIKECYRQDNELVLISYNPTYTPVRYPIDECKIIGKFLGVIRGQGKMKISLV